MMLQVGAAGATFDRPAAAAVAVDPNAAASLCWCWPVAATDACMVSSISGTAPLARAISEYALIPCATLKSSLVVFKKDSFIAGLVAYAIE